MAKVLLVEDDNNLREIYQARLQAEGYDIVSARDGEEALVIAKQEQPELVISDVMMPKISGFEMLDILRNTEGLKEVKVIMLTALGQAEDQTRADSLGADRYLVKSQVTLEDIVNAAQDLLTEAGALPPVEAAAVPPVTSSAEPVASAPAPMATPDSVVSAPVQPMPVAEPLVAEPTPAPQPVPVAASAPATPPANPMPEPTPVPTPVPAPEPAPVAEPAAAPVIPLATAPPDMPEAGVMPSMPPTPVSTIPDVPSPDPVADQPVVAEPLTELVPAAPESVPAAVVDSQPTQVAASSGQTGDNAEPQTEAQETAAIEQQIVDFVEQQSGEPAPAADPSVAPASVEPEVPQPETTPEQEQVLNDALTKLGGAPEPVSSDPEPDAPASEAAPATAPLAASPAELEAPSHQKKVITPLNDEVNGAPKKSINELLAAEEAKNSGSTMTPSAPATPPTTPEPTKNPNDFDPNSIAL